MVSGKRLTLPNRCSTAATIRSRTSLLLMPTVVSGSSWLPDHSSRVRRRPAPSHRCRSRSRSRRSSNAIAFIYRDPTVVPPLDTAGVAIEQETVGLHHSIDSFVIGRLAPKGHLLSGRPCPVTSGAISRR